MSEFDQQDPNQERDEVPFPNPHGPPRYQPAAAAPELVTQPHRGNGHGAAYAQPQPSLNLQGQGAPQTVGVLQAAMQQQAMPYQGVQVASSPLIEHLRTIRVAAEVGAFELAELWAQQLQIFRNEYQRRTGQALSDHEAFQLVTAPLVMALES